MKEWYCDYYLFKSNSAARCLSRRRVCKMRSASGSLRVEPVSFGEGKDWTWHADVWGCQRQYEKMSVRWGYGDSNPPPAGTYQCRQTGPVGLARQTFIKRYHPRISKTPLCLFKINNWDIQYLQLGKIRISSSPQKIRDYLKTPFTDLNVLQQMIQIDFWTIWLAYSERSSLFFY